MKHWEYRREPFVIEDDELNALGEQGWEAVCALPDRTLLFKREKDEGFGMPVLPEPHEPKAPGPN